MTFCNLEERVIEAGQEEDFFFVFERLAEPTRTTLGYALDIAQLLKENGLQDQYMITGGYGALMHLLGVLGERSAVTWRGSEDIDMFGSIDVLRALQANYRIKENRESPNLPEKGTLILATKELLAPEKDVRVDFSMKNNLYTDDGRGRFKPTIKGLYQPAKKVIFGVEVSVADVPSLIRSKAPLAAKEGDEFLKQKIDVMNLLWVAEQERISHKDIYGPMTERNERANLRQAIKDSWTLVTNERTKLGPSKEFTDQLVHELHKYK